VLLLHLFFYIFDWFVKGKYPHHYDHYVRGRCHRSWESALAVWNNREGSDVAFITARLKESQTPTV
jgi:hypothetical protein